MDLLNPPIDFNYLKVNSEIRPVDISLPYRTYSWMIPRRFRTLLPLLVNLLTSEKGVDSHLMRNDLSINSYLYEIY